MVELYLFVTHTFAQSWDVFATGAIIGSVTLALICVLLQDQIVGGLTVGAVRE
jgi:ABC-type maltose transport system permease subunit